MAKLIVNPDRSLFEVEAEDAERIGPMDYDPTDHVVVEPEDGGTCFLAVGEDYDGILKPGLYELKLVSAGVTEGEIEEDEDEDDVEIEDDEDEEEVK